MSESLTSSRMEAFSDGVIAVIITIMVLELKVPSLHDMSNWEAIRSDLPLVFVYLLSFVQTGIYWVQHHYLVDDVEHVTHGMLWANLALLFSLSLIPWATNWVAASARFPSRCTPSSAPFPPSPGSCSPTSSAAPPANRSPPVRSSRPSPPSSTSEPSS
jgi:uncharacterized membrane protein